MGILNLTPDSFYAGSRHNSIDSAVAMAGKMLAEGADILDLGGMSSRPGAKLIPAEEEQQRVLPFLKAIKDKFPSAIISVDTVYGGTAAKAVAAGAGMINDISAGSIDPEMFAVLPSLRVPYVLMHMAGQPENMQSRTDYTNLITEIWDFLAQKHAALTAAGVHDIIIDPGFGFGKTVAQNYALLQQLNAFAGFNRPVLAGLSRKSMIWRPLRITPETALNATTALHVIALQQGASILRVHDVREAVEVIQLLDLVNGSDSQ